MVRFDRTLILFLALVANALKQAKTDQAVVDYLSQNLGVRWTVVDNLEPGGQFLAKLQITNNGNQEITSHDWKIYMPSIRLVERDRIRPNGTEFGEGQGLWIRHVNGDVFSVEPMSNFMGFMRTSPLIVDYKASDWTVSRTDVMPNWYVTSSNAVPKSIATTVGEELEFVEAFTSERQLKRTSEDQYDPYTPQKRLELSATPNQGRAPLRLLPQPIYENLTSSQLVINPDWYVVREKPELEFEAQYLAETLGIPVMDAGSPPADKYIWLTIGNVTNTDGSVVETAEAYRVDINQDAMTVHVTGRDAAGVMHGVQTLLSVQDAEGRVPEGTVVDYPRYPYRGMHMDVSRNFHGKADVLRHLEVMSMYKLNKFYFHLTDDEGWRLEIPGIPELTEVGSKRCHDLTGDQCILPQLGAGPTYPNHGTGHFSTIQYQEILQYAKNRHIQVIPEFDMPGHCHALINAILARYRKYKDSNITMAEEYLLTDLEDKSDYLSVQQYTDNAVNPCIESSYRFIDHLVRTIVGLHKDIQPLETFNFGGDEVPSGAWLESPQCKELMTRENLNTSSDIKQYFVKRVAWIAHNHSLDLSGWEDGLMDGNDPYDRASLPNNNVFGYFWDNVWEWGSGQRAYAMANAGYKAILSHATHFYFDFPHEPDPEERGYYWATRFTDTKKTFSYTPTNIYDNMGVDRMGKPIDKDNICQMYGCVALQPGKEKNILGIQGHVWSETVRTSEQLDYMMFPRLLAVAERAWHTANWERVEVGPERDSLRQQDWEQFANTLGHKELARLDSLTVNYQIPPAGAKIEENNILVAESNYPGLPIQYSVNNQETWLDYRPGIIIQAGTNVSLRTLSASRDRYSRLVILQNHHVSSGIRQTQLDSIIIVCLFIVVSLIR